MNADAIPTLTPHSTSFHRIIIPGATAACVATRKTYILMTTLGCKVAATES